MPITMNKAPMTVIRHVKRLLVDPADERFEPHGKEFLIADDGSLLGVGDAYKAGGPGRFTVTEIGTAEDLVRALDGLEPGEVVVWGKPPAMAGRTTYSGREKPDEALWSRSSRSFFEFTDPAVLVIDCDLPVGIVPPLAEMIDWMRSIGFDCDLVGGGSSSAGIRHAGTGALMKDSAGLRIYALVDRGSRIRDILEMIIERGWLCGWSRWMIGSSGTLYERGPADNAMHSPVQADFSAAGAILGEGLTQDRGWTLFPGKERVQDVSRLAWLEDDETEDNGRWVEEEVAWRRRYAYLMAVPESKAKAAAWAERQAVTKAKMTLAAGEFDNITAALEAARPRVKRDIATSRKTGVLPGWLILHTARGQVAVEDILAEPDPWHMVACCEPMEPDYRGGARTSTILTRGGVPVVNSHRGGITTWRLARFGGGRK